VAKRSNYRLKSLKARGHKVVTYSVGSGDEAVFLLNGGPGLPCDYLRDPHTVLADHGFHVVTYDQLGCGESDNPQDMSLWTIGGYVEEVESVRQQLGLGKVHLLGHSWGGWLAIEYALTFPDSLKSLVLADTCGDMMLRHEAEGTLDHPEYQAAVTILNYRHVCRLSTYPDPINRSLKNWNMTIYGRMQGPNEFLYTGNLKDWNRIPDMHRIKQSTLVIAGMHDELTPACALRMHQALPKSQIKIFQNSSHMPFYEEPDQYFPVLLGFLDQQRGKSAVGNKPSPGRRKTA